MTFSGKRMDMSFRGFSERGRPPLLTLPRASMSSVNSGSSLYSCRRMTWASTRLRSEPKERRDARFLAVICFPHTENMAFRATRRVANNDDPSAQHTKTDDSRFAVVPALVFDFECRPGENQFGVLEIETAIGKGCCSFPWIECDYHRLLYLQQPELATSRSERVEVKPNALFTRRRRRSGAIRVRTQTHSSQGATRSAKTTMENPAPSL
jgi:hypothetical protein